MLEQIQPYLPIIAIAAGVFLLFWSQLDRFVALASMLLPTKTEPEPGLTPQELFSRILDLRTWCEAAGHAEAVNALDACVLPAIVRSTPVVIKGGTKS